VKVVVSQGRHRHQQKPGRVEQMSKAQLRGFIERVTEKGSISANDVKHLSRSVLEDGVSTREEVEALLALDRALDADPSWADALMHMIVDFVVWGSRPTGYVTADDARWLVAVLDAHGPTATAVAIAAAVVAEAHEADEALRGFAERGPVLVPEVLAA
jgi:hypothetical protein